MTVSVPTLEDLDAVRAEVAALRVEVAALHRERVRVEQPLVEWMSAKKFAARRGLSLRTIAKLVKKGMPSEKVGRARRIDVVGAEAWLAARGTAT